MPVTYEEKNKDLPGYMQVYQMELNRKLENGIISTITPTNDVSLRTFMIRYTPENTFRFKPSGLFRSPSAFVFSFFYSPDHFNAGGLYKN
ncbi:hypothetical protein SAMN04488122_1917 [Chitinophaga arvensicola]|uniref:Uncharacterized protein n=1 Tax=Chitinophaga arvensicola TaxID=29529 RepID=A0A1I0QYV5_9BACT|nr:hypothetical protein SAMN04488122_1917 [Chitinophaga arvensicola]